MVLFFYFIAYFLTDKQQKAAQTSVTKMFTIERIGRLGEKYYLVISSSISRPKLKEKKAQNTKQIPVEQVDGIGFQNLFY